MLVFYDISFHFIVFFLLVDDAERGRLAHIPVRLVLLVTEDVQRTDNKLVLARGSIVVVGQLAVKGNGRDTTRRPQSGEASGLANSLEALKLEDGLGRAGSQGDKVGSDLGGAHGHVDGKGRKNVLGSGLAGSRNGKGDVGLEAVELVIVGVGDPSLIGLKDLGLVERAGKSLVRDRQRGTVSAVDGNIARPESQTLAVKTSRGGRENLNGSRLAGREGELVVAELQSGLGVNGLVGEGIGVG